MDSFNWITINYHLPVTPSGSRVYAWRKLKELGAAYLRQGVAVLPYSADNLRRVQPLAVKIRSMGGQCTLTEMRFIEEKDHRQMVENFKTQSKDEFKELLLDAVQLCDTLGVGEQDHPDKAIQKRYQKARSRDYFNIENEIGSTGLWAEFFSEIKTEVGWAELLDDLRQGCKDVGRMVAGLRPEQNHRPEEDRHDNITL